MAKNDGNTAKSIERGYRPLAEGYQPHTAHKLPRAGNRFKISLRLPQEVPASRLPGRTPAITPEGHCE